MNNLTYFKAKFLRIYFKKKKSKLSHDITSSNLKGIAVVWSLRNAYFQVPLKEMAFTSTN